MNLYTVQASTQHLHGFIAVVENRQLPVQFHQLHNKHNLIPDIAQHQFSARGIKLSMELDQMTHGTTVNIHQLVAIQDDLGPRFLGKLIEQVFDFIQRVGNQRTAQGYNKFSVDFLGLNNQVICSHVFVSIART